MAGKMKSLLQDPLGLGKIEPCPLEPVKTERCPVPAALSGSGGPSRRSPDDLVPLCAHLAGGRAVYPASGQSPEVWLRGWFLMALCDVYGLVQTVRPERESWRNC